MTPRDLMALRGAVCVALACLTMLRSPRAAQAQERQLPVQVIEIAGQDAYLSSGREQGLRMGTAVRFGHIACHVTRLTRSYAVVSAARLHAGARGIARVTQEAAPTRQNLSPPRPLSAFAGQWPAAAFPASDQRPSRVPFARLHTQQTHVDASLSSTGAALVPVRSDKALVGRGELRARLRVAANTRIPITLSADLSLQKWIGRYATGVASGDRRPLLLARELALTIGADNDYRAQVGRIRYAATNLGPIDGARLQAAHLGPLHLSGFGGLLPDPITGLLDPNTGRFGVELDVEGDPRSGSPEFTMVVNGSVFQGRLDERRLFARGQIWPGTHRIEAYAQAVAFDPNNPWGRPQLDLSAAGADADLRFGAFRLSARIDMRRPERSYWLAHALPTTWLCSSASARVSTPACAGNDDTRYLAQAAATWSGQLITTQADAAWIGSSEPTLGSNTLLHAMLRTTRPIGLYDLGLGGSFERGSLLRTNLGLRADVGLNFARERVRIHLYYRPVYRRYAASVAPLWVQGAGIGIHIAPSPQLTVDMQGDTRLGDVDAILAMLSVRYRLLR